jgi:hypothetical protein
MSTPLTGQVFTPSDITQKDDVATEVQIFTSPILLDKLVDYFGNERVLTSMRGRWDWVADHPNFVFKQLAGLPPVAQVLATIGYESKPRTCTIKPCSRFAHLNVEGCGKRMCLWPIWIRRSELSADALNALVGIYMDHQLSIRKGKGAREFFDEQTKQMRGELQQAELRRRLQRQMEHRLHRRSKAASPAASDAHRSRTS